MAKRRPRSRALPRPLSAALSADLGYYDLRVPETRAEQAALAREHGIGGFCYYHYWFNGRRLLERPLDDVHRSGAPDFPFCVCWANENWTRRWDGHDDDILVAQQYSPEADRRLAADLAPLFRDRRYIRVHDRPLFIVYRAASLPDPRGFAERFREQRARRNRRSVSRIHPAAGLALTGGVGVRCSGRVSAARLRRRRSDAARRVPFARNRGEGLGLRAHREIRDRPYAARVPAVPWRHDGWDNTPRLPRNGHVFVNAHPANYERWLAAIVAQTQQRAPPGERLVFINAWNEWAEGCHLEPDEAFGTAYLEATRRASATGRA
jgi:lipopolysaccharide biosynthesis protein